MVSDLDAGVDDGFGESSRYAAHLDRGWSLLERGEYATARNSANHAQGLKPDAPDAWMLLGAIALNEGDPESALACYERALEVDGDYLEAHVARCQLLVYDLASPERALIEIDATLDLDEANLPVEQLDLGLLAAEALVALGRSVDAAERLKSIEALQDFATLFDPQHATERVDDLARFMGESDDDEDEDERQNWLGRLCAIAARLGRTWLDAGDAERSAEVLRMLVQHMGDDPEVWYLLNDAEYALGRGTAAVQAALHGYRLDAADPLPPWAPSPDDVHAEILEVLGSAKLRPLHERTEIDGLLVMVHEAPSLELLLEGLDPRASAVVLGLRDRGEEGSANATPTGLVVYRRNLVRFARDRAQASEELRRAIINEFAAFLGLDERTRGQLGLEAPPVRAKA